jgi:hypothetical protein
MSDKKKSFINKLILRRQVYVDWLGEYELDEDANEPIIYDSVSRRLKLINEIIELAEKEL